jgi:hypothetical protein
VGKGGEVEDVYLKVKGGNQFTVCNIFHTASPAADVGHRVGL